MEVVWSASPDNDYPADNFVKDTYKKAPGIKSSRVLYIKPADFDPSIDPFDNYSLSGDTHARDSHALKHYAEWSPADVVNKMEEIKKAIIDHEDGLIVFSSEKPDMSKGPDMPEMSYNRIDPQSITPGDLINTLDRINDSIINGEYVNDVELAIYRNYFIPLAVAYESMADNLVKNAVDVSDNNTRFNSVEDLVIFLNSSPIIKFNGVYRGSGSVNTYFYDMSNTILASAKGPDNSGEGPFATIFKMDKKHRDYNPSQSLRFFRKRKATVPKPDTHTKLIQAIEILSPTA